LGNEDAGAEKAEAGDDDDPEMMAEGKGFADDADGDGDGDTVTHADAGDDVSAKGRDDEADEIDGEQIAELEGGETEGRIGEIEGGVSKGGDEGEEDAESDTKGGKQAGIAEVAESDPEGGGGVLFRMQVRARRTFGEPAGDEGGADEGEEAEGDEAPAPAEGFGDEAGEEAAEESAACCGADVEAHDEGDGFATPLLADVGDDGGEDAGKGETLEESPEDEHVKVGRGCREERGHSKDEIGGHDDALAAEAFGERAEDGGGEGNAEGGGADGEADGGFRRVKEVSEHRQQRLSGIEIEKGEDAAEIDGGDGTQRAQAHVALGVRLDGNDRGIGGGEFGRRQGRVH
jgi:hypothetical protein